MHKEIGFATLQYMFEWWNDVRVLVFFVSQCLLVVSRRELDWMAAFLLIPSSLDLDLPPRGMSTILWTRE